MLTFEELLKFQPIPTQQNSFLGRIKEHPKMYKAQEVWNTFPDDVKKAGLQFGLPNIGPLRYSLSDTTSVATLDGGILRQGSGYTRCHMEDVCMPSIAVFTATNVESRKYWFLADLDWSPTKIARIRGRLNMIMEDEKQIQTLFEMGFQLLVQKPLQELFLGVGQLHAVVTITPSPTDLTYCYGPVFRTPASACTLINVLLRKGVFRNFGGNEEAVVKEWFPKVYDAYEKDRRKRVSKRSKRICNLQNYE